MSHHRCIKQFVEVLKQNVYLSSHPDSCTRFIAAAVSLFYFFTRAITGFQMISGAKYLHGTYTITVFLNF